MSERIQRKIASLLERAAHPGTDEHERESCLRMADEMMAKHKIERSLISWERPIEERRKPTTLYYEPLHFVDNDMIRSRRHYSEYEVSGTLTGLRQTIFRFVGARCRFDYRDGKNTLVVVGYEEDIYYGEMLWNMTLSEIVRSMYPTWSKAVSMDENVYKLKSAGYSWPQIREIGLENGAKDAHGSLTFENAGSKLRSAYRRYAKSIGESGEMPKVRQPEWWRVSFADGFAKNLGQRLAAIKMDRESYFDGKNLPALQKDEQAVKDLFEEHFPPPPPLTEEEFAEQKKREEEWDRKNKNRKVPVPKVRYYDPSGYRSGVASSNRVKLTHDEQLKMKKEIG